MIIELSRLLQTRVLSLQLGGPIGEVTDAIVDHENLKILALRLRGPMINAKSGDILTVDSIREFGKLGIIINSADDLVGENDVIRVADILKLQFSLIGLKALTKRGTKLGTVTSYHLETNSMMVKDLIVKRRGFKAISDPELFIPRSEIVEINDYEVIVKDEEAKIKVKAEKENFIPDFVNPFREANFAPAQTQTPGGKDN
ncbi:PRC-barrel domain-containing protein [Candidatus Saccharibacteria bacterium]|nr:PRC-barrel domain-containing protein [Candidatus Saccharibacteria bacterium]MBQ3318589.1 PRC-barrel domain-containing protein [Candidatus Saccharibacteria bacterium]